MALYRRIEMRVTVAICTWNRCTSLSRTLDSLARLSVPSGVDWELLVINNNCTDATDEVVAAFQDALPIRRHLEPQPGQASARNRAIREAVGDYIIWTDDDVSVTREWLEAYVEAFRHWPDAVVFGGPIEPCFEGTPPAWLLRGLPRIGGIYAQRKFAEARSLCFAEDVIPYGANYAVRHHEQARYLYDPELGLRPNSSLRGEEIELVARLLADGYTGRWVPRAVIKHHVPEANQTVRYLRRCVYGRGQLMGRQLANSDGPHLFEKPRWLWRMAVEAEVRYRIHRIFSAPEVWIERLETASECWGQLAGYSRARRPQTDEAQPAHSPTGPTRTDEPATQRLDPAARRASSR